MKRRLHSFVAVGLVLIAGLLALELGLRLVDRAIDQRSWQRGLMVPDADRGWIGRPHAARWVDTGEYAVFVENDEDGYRVPDPLAPPHPSQRVLILGGSTAWGRGVGRGGLTSDWLARERPSLAVHNRAIDAYWLGRIQRTFELALAEGQYDEIVLLLSPSDAAWHSEPEIASDCRVVLEDRSLAARFLSSLWETLERPVTSASGPTPLDLDKSLAALVERAGAAGARLVLVYAPTATDVEPELAQAESAEESAGEPESRTQPLRDALALASRAKGVEFLDLSAAFRSASSGQASMFFPDSGSWNQRAHFLAAQALLDSNLLKFSRPIELGADAVRIGPHHPDLVSLGRVDRSDDSRLVFDWPGVAIRARVLAPSARFLLSSEKGSQYFDVRVDGERRFVARVSPDARPIDLANLGPGAHDLEIRKRNDPSSPISFRGLELPPGGRILPPAARPRRQMEVLGASVASGHGNEGNAYGWQNRGSELRYCPNTHRSTNAGSSFGFVLGDWYDAEVHLIAEGSRGIIRSYGETQPRSDRTLPLIAARTLATRPEIWDAAGWRPEVVIINLGENDVSKAEGFEPETFRDEYVSFLENLRARRDEAFFVLLNEEEREGLCRNVREVIAVRRAAGDERIAAICYTEPARRDLGCDTHPNTAAHVDVARMLAEVIEPALGWRRPGEPR